MRLVIRDRVGPRKAGSRVGWHKNSFPAHLCRGVGLRGLGPLLLLVPLGLALDHGAGRGVALVAARPRGGRKGPGWARRCGMGGCGVASGGATPGLGPPRVLKHPAGATSLLHRVDKRERRSTAWAQGGAGHGTCRQPAMAHIQGASHGSCTRQLPLPSSPQVCTMIPRYR